MPSPHTLCTLAEHRTCRRLSSPLSPFTEDSFSRRYASRSSSCRPTGPNHVLSRNTCRTSGEPAKDRDMIWWEKCQPCDGVET